jgi:tRNA(Ile)-lysidine synthase
MGVLEEINTQAVSHMYQASEEVREVMVFVEYLASVARNKYFKDGICAEALTEEPKIVQNTLLHHLLGECAGSRKNISRVHIEQTRELFGKQVGKELSLPYGVVARRTYGGIEILKEEKGEKEGEEVQEYPLKDGFVMSIPSTDMVLSCQIWEKIENLDEIPKKTYTKYLDYDKIKGGVVLRKRKQGDYFVLDGEGRSQKLNDYFINEKVPSAKRDEIWLLADESHVLWAIGYRISEAAKITDDTKRILQVQIEFGGKTDEPA